MPGNLRDVLGVAALVQCLVKALSDQIDAGTYQHDCHPMMVRQNKWRASRFGNRAQLVNSYSHELESVSQTVCSLIHRLRPVAEQLDCVKHLEYVQQMADGPSWSDQQRAILKETGDPAEVVRRLTTESRISDTPASEPTTLPVREG
jgi:carboxylate-amine ligase